MRTVALVAYVVGDGTVDADGIRGYLRERLPGHLVPAHVELLDAMPTGTNGKIDHDALPAPGRRRPRRRTGSHRGPATERRLAELWCELLEVPSVGATTDFFDLGGHSLLATRLMTRVRETFGVDLALRGSSPTRPSPRWPSVSTAPSAARCDPSQFWTVRPTGGRSPARRGHRSAGPSRRSPPHEHRRTTPPPTPSRRLLRRIPDRSGGLRWPAWRSSWLRPRSGRCRRSARPSTPGPACGGCRRTRPAPPPAPTPCPACTSRSPSRWSRTGSRTSAPTTTRTCGARSATSTPGSGWWSTDLERRTGSGTLSAVLGQAAFDLDTFELDLGLQRAAERDWKAMADGPTRTALIAYAAGSTPSSTSSPRTTSCRPRSSCSATGRRRGPGRLAAHPAGADPDREPVRRRPHVLLCGRRPRHRHLQGVLPGDLAAGAAPV